MSCLVEFLCWVRVSAEDAFCTMSCPIRDTDLMVCVRVSNGEKELWVGVKK